MSRRLGFALVGTAGPALIAVFLVALAGGSVTDPVDWIAGALSTPLVGETGTEWAFHVAVVTALAGVWVVGLALVVEGYFGVE